MRPMVEHLIAAGVRPASASEWLAPVREACERFEINTDLRIAAFLSQCAHESGGFTRLEENLMYTADRLAVIWPSRFAEMGGDKKPKKDAKGLNVPNKFALALHRQPELIANVVYSSRMGNGPVESGEGWLYRGRGLKQLTGKDNYKRCGQGLGEDLLSSPDLLLAPRCAALSAAWFWAASGCSKFADASDIEGLTRKINGGLIGIDDRKKRYANVIKAMKTGVA